MSHRKLRETLGHVSKHLLNATLELDAHATDNLECAVRELHTAVDELASVVADCLDAIEDLELRTGNPP